MNLLERSTQLINKLLPQDELKKILLNAGWLIADKGIRMVMSLVVGIWVARYFGPINFGVYSYSVAFISLFNAAATLGIDGLVVRDIVKEPERKSIILGSAALLKLLSSIVSITLTLVTIFLLKRDDTDTMILVFIMSLTFLATPFDVIDFFFQSKLVSKYTIIARLSSLVLVNALRVAAVMSSLSLLYFGVIQVIEAVLSAVFLMLIFNYTGNKLIHWRIDGAYVKGLFISSFGLLIDSVLVVLNMQVDRIIIEYYHSEKEVGIYSVGVNLSQLWYFIPVFIGASTVPMMINKFRQDLTQYEKSLKVLFRIMMYSSLTLAITFSLLSSHIIEFLYGASYMDSAQILSFYIWTCIFVFHVSIRSRSLIVEEKSRYVGAFSLIMTTLNIILNFMLVPKYGGLGAAASSLSAWGISVLIVPLFFSATKKYPIYFLRSFTI